MNCTEFNPEMAEARCTTITKAARDSGTEKDDAKSIKDISDMDHSYQVIK